MKKLHPKFNTIKPLVEGVGECIASDEIMVDGKKVGYMYRAEPEDDEDSGWRFLSGDESDETMEDDTRHGLYDVNIVANGNPDIIDLLDSPFESEFERDEETGLFVEVSDDEDDEDDDDDDDDDEELGVEPDTRELHPGYPVITGLVPLNDRWELTLPVEFNRRIEEGELVIWRPGLTFWTVIWGNDHSEEIAERLEWIIDEASPDRIDQRIDRRDDATLLTYELIEKQRSRSGGVVRSLSGYVIGSHGHIQITAYCDNADAMSIAYAVIGSVRNRL